MIAQIWQGLDVVGVGAQRLLSPIYFQFVSLFADCNMNRELARICDEKSLHTDLCQTPSTVQRLLSTTPVPE